LKVKVSYTKSAKEPVALLPEPVLLSSLFGKRLALAVKA
jgi:hypothetical protein